MKIVKVVKLESNRVCLKKVKELWKLTNLPLLVCKELINETDDVQEALKLAKLRYGPLRETVTLLS